MKIGIVSTKGGVGKTTIAINLSSYLKLYYNKKVLIIDLNKGNHSTEIFVDGVKSFGNRLWQGIILSRYFHLKIVDDLPQDFEKDINILEKIYDYIIFDIPPEIDSIKRICNMLDIIFLIVTPDLFSIYSNYYLYKILPQDKVKIIVNKYDKKIDLSYIEKIFNKNISAVIEYKKDFVESNIYLMPLPYLKKGSSLKDLDELASLITGERKIKGIIERIVDILK